MVTATVLLLILFFLETKMELLFVLKVLGGIVGFVIGIVVGSFVAAIWLRLAAQWLRFGNIPYFTAFKSALISNFIVYTFNLSIGFNHGLTTAMISQMFSTDRSRSIDYAFTYPPIFFVYSTIFGLVATAAIFCRTLPSKDTDTRIPFLDAFALASLYFALAFAFMLSIGLIAFSIISIPLALQKL